MPGLAGSMMSNCSSKAARGTVCQGFFLSSSAPSANVWTVTVPCTSWSAIVDSSPGSPRKWSPCRCDMNIWDILAKRAAVAAELQLSALAAIDEHGLLAIAHQLRAGHMAQGGSSRSAPQYSDGKIRHSAKIRISRAQKQINFAFVEREYLRGSSKILKEAFLQKVIKTGLYKRKCRHNILPRISVLQSATAERSKVLN